MKKNIILIILLLLTGCTKYYDLAELTIIKSIGISYNGKYNLYAQIIDYIDKDNEPHMKLVTASGNTIEDSFKNLKNTINKESYLSHIDLLILDNNLNNDNYSKIFQYFINNQNFRNDFLTITSPNIKKLLNNSKYDEIELFLKEKKNNNVLLLKSFNEILEKYLNTKTLNLSNITYNNQIIYLGEYQYANKSKN